MQAYRIRPRVRGNNCVPNTEVSYEDCSKAAAFSNEVYTCGSCTPIRSNDTSLPPGCSISSTQLLYYNENKEGINNGQYAPVCHDVSASSIHI